MFPEVSTIDKNHPTPILSLDDALGGIGVSYIWDLTEAPDGRIYGGCYSPSKLLEYDPRTKTVKDLGAMSKGRNYVRYLAAAPDGKIWCRVSFPSELYIYDPTTGEKRQTEYSPSGVLAKGRSVYVGARGNILRFDPKSEKLVHTLTGGGTPIPGDYTRGLYLARGGAICFYDPDANRMKKLAEGGYLGMCKWVEADRYVHGMIDQDYYCYDLQEKKFLVRKRLTPPDGPGMKIYAVCSGPDGNIYGGVYINQHLWKVEAATGKVIELGRHRRDGGQIDSITCGGGRVWCGSYYGAYFASYDPKKPWNPGAGSKDNPRDYGGVGHGQIRTRCILYGPDGKVYMGSYPSYKAGNTDDMSVLDPETGKVKLYINLAPRCLAAGKKMIFGCSTRKFFAFDPGKKKVVCETPARFSAMVGLPDGRIACGDSGQVKIFDPATMKFVVTKNYEVGKIDTLTLGRNQACVYGISDTAVFRIDIADLSIKILHRGGGRFMAEDRFGNLYFARGAALFRLVRR